MKNTRYTTDELELVQYMETNPKSIPNKKEMISKIKNIVQNKETKKKQINFRINEKDLEELKNKASIEGIPYQTLLNSIVHKFLNGTLVHRDFNY